MSRPGWARPSGNPRPPEGPRTPMRGEIAEPSREIVEVHDDEDAPTLYLVEPSAATAAELDGTPHRLDDLDDVELPAASAPDSILVRGTDGILRPMTLADAVPEHQRGAIHHLVTDLSEATDVRPGEWVTVIDGPDRGAVYQIGEQ